MNKDREWVFMKLGKMFPSHSEIHDYSDNITVTKCEILNQVYDILSQLDVPEVLSQELPVIPKYVADYLEFAKKNASLIQVMETASVVNGWITMKKEFDWILANDETFARAWLDGYRLAEEPLYYALFKGHEFTLDSYKNLGLYRETRSPMYISYKDPLSDEFVIKMSKNEWNELGINDSNANFIKAEDMK